MARQYNKSLRLLKAYNKYVDVLNKRVGIWSKKGYTPVDTTPLSFEDYVANREFLASRGIASGNITNMIVSQQLYEFNQAQASNLVNMLKSYGITSINGKRLTVEFIKAGGGKEALSVLNDLLKMSGVESGYERSQIITENIYQDSL